MENVGDNTKKEVNHIKGFQFMANKQFRMEKILGTSVCADISQYVLKTKTLNLYMKKSLNTFNLDDNLVFF